MDLVNKILEDGGYLDKGNDNVNHCTDTDNCQFININNSEVCKNCGRVSYYHPFVDSSLSYLSPRIYYKRANHLVEVLNQYQGIERARIPEAVMRLVKRKLKNIKINEVNSNIIRSVLIKTNNAKYLDHSRYILNILYQKTEFKLKRSDELLIKLMFSSIQAPFDRVNKKKRKNFLNYSFVVSQLCNLIGVKNDIFMGFKNSRVLSEHLEIWEGICQILGWVYMKPKTGRRKKNDIKK